MEIKKVTDPEFRKYGKVVENIDFSGLIRALTEKTPLPADVVYEPSAEVLEAEPVFETVQKKAYGEMPVQIGYCNGHNHKLNALEYHRSSEINVAATDVILLVGHQQDITPEFTYDTSWWKHFFSRRERLWRCMPQPCITRPAVWESRDFRSGSYFRAEPIIRWK